MKHEHTRTFEQQARIAALKAEDAQREEQELRAEYEEAVETVYAGRTFPEYACREHGHGDCAFTERGACTGEQIDREIGRMRDKAAERTLLPPHPKGNFSPEALAEERQHLSLLSHQPPVRHKVSIRDRHGNFTRLVGEFATWQEADAARRDVGPLNAGYFVRTEVVDDKPIPLAAKCPECGRTFDLLDEQEAEEMAFGHDCEAQS